MKVLTLNICFFLIIFQSCSTIDVNKQISVGIRQYEHDSLKESISTLSRIILITDTCKQCYQYRGFAYKNLDEYSNAISDFNSLINLDPKESTAFANRASVFYAKGDYESALKDFTMAYQLDSGEVYLNPICHMLFINGFKDSACIYYHKLSEKGDSNFDNSIKRYCETQNSR